MFNASRKEKLVYILKNAQKMQRKIVRFFTHRGTRAESRAFCWKFAEGAAAKAKQKKVIRSKEGETPKDFFSVASALRNGKG